jgi:hypothetical protein
MAFLTRRQLGEFLRSHGFPAADETMRLATMPSRGTGPPAAGYFGRTQIWDEGVTLDWARANLTPKAKPLTKAKPDPTEYQLALRKRRQRQRETWRPNKT